MEKVTITNLGIIDAHIIQEGNTRTLHWGWNDEGDISRQRNEMLGNIKKAKACIDQVHQEMENGESTRPEYEMLRDRMDSISNALNEYEYRYNERLF